MCGIAGQIGWNAQTMEHQRVVYQNMQQTLQRRGPDQNGIFQHGNAALIHARLSVVDLEHGRQPMELTWRQETYVLVYNGELYNTQELRGELQALGHTFTGHSDTEVLLHAYAQWREQCVHRLNGIFAFAIWEQNQQQLFLARDRMGVKPLFYTLKEDTLIFASELKTLLAHPLVKPVADLQSIAELILIGPGRTPGCGVFRDIKELKPAQYAYYSRDGLAVTRYWRLTDRPHTDTPQQTVEKVRWLVQDSIERQLVSDVPVCTFLSGGLDSSIISALADRYFHRKGIQLHTFSVNYIDNERYFQSGKFQPESDTAFIRQMNRSLNAIHHNITLDTVELADALYEAVDARDLPGMADVDASLLLFCREIKQHATVALSGECADEIFGGYPWYRDREIRERFGFPWAQTTDYRASFLHPDIAALLDVNGYVTERYAATLQDCSKLPGLSSDEARIKEMVNLNFDWFMQTLLDRKDRMSMYSGLEVRVPFCDDRIAGYLYTVPWNVKEYHGMEKGLLREAFRDLLPHDVLWRKKSPYPKTHHPVYLETVRNRLREVLEQKDAPILNIMQKEVLAGLLEDNRMIPWYGQLMTTPQTIAYMLQLNYWLQKYHVEIRL